MFDYFAVLMCVILIWWGMFYWRGLRDWSAERFYFRPPTPSCNSSGGI